MGALLESDDRMKIEQYFINQNTLDIPRNNTKTNTIFDYLVNDNGQWGNNP